MTDMILNVFKIILRNLRKNPVISAIYGYTGLTMHKIKDPPAK